MWNSHLLLLTIIFILFIYNKEPNERNRLRTIKLKIKAQKWFLRQARSAGQVLQQATIFPAWVMWHPLLVHSCRVIKKNPTKQKHSTPEVAELAGALPSGTFLNESETYSRNFPITCRVIFALCSNFKQFPTWQEMPCAGMCNFSYTHRIRALKTYT